MTRKKVKLAFIVDDSARRASYNKRMKGLIKKVTELTILCDIPACAIISSPFDSQTEVWPNPEEAKKVIERYQNTSRKDETRNVNQERFTLQRLAKARDQLKKVKLDNREKVLNILMFESMQNQKLPDDLTVEVLKDLDKLVEKNMKEVDDKISALD